MKRWLAGFVAFLHLSQGALAPLHAMLEEAPHAGCAACVHAPSGGAPAFGDPDGHNHALHDEGTCGLCRAARQPAQVAAFDPGETPLRAVPAPPPFDVRPVQGRALPLPPARAPPASRA